MSGITAKESVTGLGYVNVTNWRNDFNPNDQGQKIAKQIATEGAYAGLTVCGTLETIARAIYAFILKIISYFMPENDKKGFENNHVKPAIKNALTTVGVTSMAALGLKDNVTENYIDAQATAGKVEEFYAKTFPCLNDLIEA